MVPNSILSAYGEYKKLPRTKVKDNSPKPPTNHSTLAANQLHPE